MVGGGDDDDDDDADCDMTHSKQQVNAAVAAPAALVIAACMSIWASSSGTQQLLSLALPLWAGKQLLAAFVRAWALMMLLVTHVCA